MFFKFFGFNSIRLDIDTTGNKSLFHYTGHEATIGILSSECFWVSRSDALGDTSEISHIRKVLKRVWKMLNENKQMFINDMDYNGIFFKKILDYLIYLEEKIYNGNTITNFQIFLLSTSEIGDSETLYCRYSEENGYNLEFNTQELLASAYKQFSGSFVTAGRVNYNFKRQILIILNDIIEIYNLIFKRLVELGVKVIDEKIYDKIRDDVINIVSLKTYIYSVFFKNSKYKDEDEYRIAFLFDESLQKNVKHRKKESREIPYIELNFDESALKSVTIAPKNDSWMQLVKLCETVEAKSYNDLKILKVI